VLDNQGVFFGAISARTKQEDHELLESFVLQLVVDIKLAETRMVDLAYKPVRGRLADALLDLTERLSNPLTGTLSISLTSVDLGKYVGTAKETVNRLLSEMRHEGLVTTDESKIVIIDMIYISIY